MPDKVKGLLYHIEIEGRRVPYLLRRSDRARRMRAEIGLRTGLRVTLPAGMDESGVSPFLHSRRRWVLRTLRRFERLEGVIPERTLAHGSPVPWLGRELRLELSNGPCRVDRSGDTLVVRVPRRTRGAVRRALAVWYRGEAERELGSRARTLAARHGASFSSLRIGDQRTLWGSCSRKGTLSFNWRLLLAPEAVANYLVAHEVAHLDEPGHTPRFRSRVEVLCPGWRDSERWLRRNGAGLTL